MVNEIPDWADVTRAAAAVLGLPDETFVPRNPAVKLAAHKPRLGLSRVALGQVLGLAWSADGQLSIARHYVHSTEGTARDAGVQAFGPCVEITYKRGGEPVVTQCGSRPLLPDAQLHPWVQLIGVISDLRVTGGALCCNPRETDLVLGVFNDQTAKHGFVSRVFLINR